MDNSITAAAGDEPPSTGDDPQSSTNTDEPRSKQYHLSAQRRSGMATSVKEGCFSVAHVTLTGPTFLTGYLLMIGANDWQLGVMLAVPHFLMIFQLAAAYVTSYVGKRLAICSLGVACCRGIHVVLAVLPFVPGLSATERLWAVFGLLMFGHLSFMFVANTWWLWMADLVPPRIRGRYFGFRSGISLVLATFWSLAGGALLDYYRASGDQAFGFCILFCVASAFAMLGLMFLQKQYEPPMQKEEPPQLAKVFSILKQPLFRRACLFLFFWNFGFGLMSALSAKHMLGYMDMSFQRVMFYPVIVSLIGFACARKWGKLMDRVGTRTTLLLCGMVTSLVPLTWLFTSKMVHWPIWFDAVAAGLFMTGMNIAAVNLPLVVTPQKHKLHYLAVFATVTGLGIGLSSVLSGHLAGWLSWVNWNVPFLDHNLVNYHIIFSLSAVFRISSMVFLARLREENTHSLRDALGRLVHHVVSPIGRVVGSRGYLGAIYRAILVRS